MSAIIYAQPIEYFITVAVPDGHISCITIRKISSCPSTLVCCDVDKYTFSDLVDTRSYTIMKIERRHAGHIGDIHAPCCEIADRAVLRDTHIPDIRSHGKAPIIRHNTKRAIRHPRRHDRDAATAKLDSLLAHGYAAIGKHKVIDVARN